ncbi:chemotaxis protein CheD [Halobaculum sp. CBA1158]|uniref:chemotaxis protein CheD n=1 Tax=Halobaculum sp. CBA1158 TaxID=2904243 RepID=UPI001F1BEAC9|nr:chemotaxis protein CheD [Halobaculum sp. CBA1158]UIP00042.1 chemotaxis protein CheD [Halobaculum sp. CBA1158]
MSPSDSTPADAGASPSSPDASVPRRKVGLSESAVAGDDALLVTSGLGSCLGIAVYHPETGVGGLLHAMLPAADGRPGVDEKYVEEGVAALVEAVVDAGGDSTALRAKMAGAAEMIEFDRTGGGDSVGRRNVAAARAALDARGIPLVAADTGGDRGRSLRFETRSGRLHVSYAGGETVVL